MTKQSIDLPERHLRLRHRATRLIAELSRPGSAAVVAQLPPRPGESIEADVARRGTGLEAREFWTTVARLVDVAAVRLDDGRLALDRDRIEHLLDALVADSPLLPIMATRPRLRPFIERGRCVRRPTEPDLIEELYAAFAELFTMGDELAEAEVNHIIALVHDDPAEVRRGLVDRGLLRRAPGTGTYLRPSS